MQWSIINHEKKGSSAFETTVIYFEDTMLGSVRQKKISIAYITYMWNLKS